MATVNVNRNLTDQFYRYKMPKLLAKVEGKGNGIKTVIVNMVEIAKALNRPPMYPTKYFGCVLGAQVNCDPKNDRYIVNGSHESSKLQDLLDGFIQKYVLCSSCGNPETVLGVTKKGVITTSCKACGHNGTIASTDKLTTFIIRYPPTQKVAAAGPSLQPKSDKKKEKKRKDGKTSENGSPKNGSENENEKDDDKLDEENDDDDWCEDTDEQAVQRRMQELSLGAKGLMHTNELEKSSQDRLQIFFDFVQKKKAEFPDGFDSGTQKEISGEADRLEIRDKAVLALCEALFDENMLTQIKQHRTLFLRFTNENGKAQKYLLRGIELTIKLFKKDLLPKTAHILKAFYDQDILSEDAIQEWGSKANKKTVGKEMAEELRAKAAPFLKWLQEAEEEESSSNEDESDDEDPWSDPNQNGNRGPVITPQKTSTPGDDLDIDAI